MVSDQIRARGVDDPRVLDAMLRVPRHLFVPEATAEAYEDHPIAIGFGQTISQPYIVGFMLAALKLEPTHRVLEIGTGSGYQTALLAELVASVYSLDVVQELADGARQPARLARSTRNVIVRVADGHAGWPEHAPYDRIVGAAAPEGIPPALVEQLTDGGIIALPVGVSNQELVVSTPARRSTGDPGDDARAVRPDGEAPADSLTIGGRLEAAGCLATVRVLLPSCSTRLRGTGPIPGRSTRRERSTAHRGSLRRRQASTRRGRPRRARRPDGGPSARESASPGSGRAAARRPRRSRVDRRGRGSISRLARRRVNDAKSFMPTNAAAATRIRVDVQPLLDPPHVWLEERALAACDLIEVAARHGVVPGVEPMRHPVDRPDIDVVRQRVVDPRAQRFRRQIGVELEVRDLGERVHAGIGPARRRTTRTRDGRVDVAHRAIDLALHRPRVLLNLPAAVAAARRTQ